MKKNILILTCSSKHHGYCVAGIDLSTNKWIRLVSSPEVSHNEIPSSFMHYANGMRCNPLDIATIDVIRFLPGKIQKENALVNLTFTPVLQGRVNSTNLFPYISDTMNIFGGTSYLLDYWGARYFDYSLAMYLVENIQLKILTHNGNEKFKVCFRYKENNYENWSMTDPDFYSYDSGLLGDQAIIVVSIPEDNYNGNYYKFVSKIIII